MCVCVCVCVRALCCLQMTHLEARAQDYSRRPCFLSGISFLMSSSSGRVGWVGGGLVWGLGCLCARQPDE